MLDNMPQEDFLRQTGLNNFYDVHSKTAVAAKVGGDNMGLLESNAAMIQGLQRLGVAQSYAVSAFRSSASEFNTTDVLIEAGEKIAKLGDIEGARKSFKEVVDFHDALIREILKSSPEDIKNELLRYSKELFETYDLQLRDARAETSKKTDYIISGESGSFSLLSVGEIVAAKLMVRFLKLNGIDARYIDTESIDFSGNGSLNMQVISYLSGELSRAYGDNAHCVPIIPGYIAGISGGILKKLGRGYTDYTGAQAAVAMNDSKLFHDVILYIQKLYGFKSTDPGKLVEASRARTIDILSYSLTKRAISHRGAGAGLINANALSREIEERQIPILVGNPTDQSDIALINKEGSSIAAGVDLVLGRDINGADDSRVYGMANIGGKEVSARQVIYLMGENLENISIVHKRAIELLGKNGIEVIAGATTKYPKGEVSFVFKDKETATEAQRLLHAYFIENKNS